MTIVEIKMLRTRQSAFGQRIKGVIYKLPFNQANFFLRRGEAVLLTPEHLIVELRPKAVKLLSKPPFIKVEAKADLVSEPKPKAKHKDKEEK